MGEFHRFPALWVNPVEPFNPHYPLALQNHHSFLSFFILRKGEARHRKIQETMTEFLISSYPWIKSLHVISVIAWMAGLFYLPRLFVYHVEQVGYEGETSELFQTMELRLLRAIMNPAMIAVWIFGLMLVFTPGVVDWSFVWPWTKAVSVLLMTWFHHWLGLRRKEFISGTQKFSGRQYRMMNEVPTVLLIVIVLSVIAKPF